MRTQIHKYLYLCLHKFGSELHRMLQHNNYYLEVVMLCKQCLAVKYLNDLFIFCKK